MSLQSPTTTKPSQRPLLVIEQLSLFDWPFWAWLAWRCRGGYVVGWDWSLETPWLRRALMRLTNLRWLRYEDLPGTYFDAHHVAVESANDAVYEASREAEAAPIIALFRRLHDHELMEVALRRMLVDVYTLPRVKALTFLCELRTQHPHILLWPCDRRDPTAWLPPDLGAVWRAVSIPRMARLAHAVKARLELIGIALGTILQLPSRALQHPLVVALPEPRRWRVGFDIDEDGIHWQAPYNDSFVYDTDQLKPQAMLHVVRTRLRDERSRRYFEEHQMPFVEADRVPMPLSYLFRRILGQMCGGIGWLALRQLWSGQGGPFLRGATSVLSGLMRSEVLELNHRVEVFIGRDEYGVSHILRTLLYGQRGGTTIGFSHANDIYLNAVTSYHCCHVFCVWGQAQQVLLRKSLRYSRSTRVIGAGIYGLDETYRCIATDSLPERYAKLKKRYRLVGAFPSSFQEDFCISRQMSLSFYRAVLTIPERYPDVVLVIRPKGEEFVDEEIRDVLAHAGPRVIVEEQVWTYHLLAVLDLAICMAFCTVGLEAMMAGCPAIYLDETRPSRHPYERYDPCLVAHTPQELFPRVDQILAEGRYVAPEILESFRSAWGVRFDGNVVERFRQAIYTALTPPADEKTVGRQSAPAPSRLGMVLR